MTLDEIISAVRSGEAGLYHADVLSALVHDLRDIVTKAKLDMDLCRNLLGLSEHELVSPALAKYIKEHNEGLKK